MNFQEDSFNFSTRDTEVIPVQRVGVILRAFDNLPQAIQTGGIEDVVGPNKISVELMGETEVAQYLHDFLKQIQAGDLSVADLQTHVMFQAVLAKTRVIEESRS